MTVGSSIGPPVTSLHDLWLDGSLLGMVPGFCGVSPGPLGWPAGPGRAGSGETGRRVVLLLLLAALRSRRRRRAREARCGRGLGRSWTTCAGSLFFLERPPRAAWAASPHTHMSMSHPNGLSFATCSPSANNVRPWHCSQRARTAVLRLPLRRTFVKHACGKLWTLVSTSETQTRINN